MVKTTILIIDDQTLYRAGVSGTLSSQSDFEIVECDSRYPLETIERILPDIVLLGSHLGIHESALELGRLIAHRYPNTKVIILSPNHTDELIFNVLKTAAVACLNRKIDASELVTTIRRAAQGEYPINESILDRPGLAAHILDEFEDMTCQRNGLRSLIAPLTEREKRILQCVAEGNNNKKIADLLEVSEHTIKCQVSAILRKMHANHRAQAVAMALRKGWIQR